ncbi:MAG: PAS domain S-box protein [Methanosarcinaceae archaeon]|nr:PAS domain S-box protein [Methanosarcinaceae archaeon]
MSRNSRLHELQVINDIFIKISKIGDTERICSLAGRAVHEFNKDCQVLVSLYDHEIDAIRIRVVIGLDTSIGKTAGIPELAFTDEIISQRFLTAISFRPEDLGENELLLKSGRLEPFSAGLYELLGKKLPTKTCRKIEKILKPGDIRVIGLSNEKRVFGSIYILAPSGKKIKKISTIETIAGYISKRIDELYTKKALLESEHIFKSLLRQASLSYQSLDEKGCCIDVNKVWLDTLGYSYEEVLGKSFGDFLAPESVERFKKNFSQFRKSGEIHGAEFEAVRKDGKIVHILLDGKIENNQDGGFRQTHCVFKDITAQRKAERKSLVNKKLLRSMVDTITESVYLMEPDGKIVFINEAAALRLNSTIEEIMDCPVYKFLPEEIVLSRKKKVELVLSSGGPLKYEDLQRGRYYQHNLYPVYDDYYNQVSRLAVFSTDITEYKVSENKLKWELAVNRALAKLSDALIDSNNSIEIISNLVLSTSKELTNSRHGYVSSISSETGDNVVHTLDKMLKGCNVPEQYRKLVFPKGQDGLYPKLYGHSLNLKKGFYTNSPEDHPASGGNPEGHIAINNFLSVPAIVGDELMGQIGLANSKNGYSNTDLEAITKVAALYALAL